MSERRRQQRFNEAHPHLSAVDASMPWICVIKDSADNLEYWLHELQEFATLYSQARDDAPPSFAHQQREDSKGSEKGWKGKGGVHPRKGFGRFVTNARGLELCFKFHSKTRTGCHRAHQCSKCLGEHPETNCNRKGKGNKNKGNGDYRKDEAASGK